MKHLKMLGLVGIVAGSLMAFAGAGTAAATELTCAAGTMCPAPTHIHLINEETVTLHAAIGDIECSESTITGRANTGTASTTVISVNSSGAAAELEALTFGNCNASVRVLKKGSLEIHTRTTSADGNGTLTSQGLEVEIVLFGIPCLATTDQGTDIGTLTGSSNTGTTATLDISARLSIHGAFCGSTLEWTGSYTVTTPDFLTID